MGNKKNQTGDLSRQSDECRTENLGTEQGNTGRMGKDNSRQSINNPGQRSDSKKDNRSSGRSSQLNERTGRADEEPVDENSDDLP
jgi:hypothetical protein